MFGAAGVFADASRGDSKAGGQSIRHSHSIIVMVMVIMMDRKSIMNNNDYFMSR